MGRGPKQSSESSPDGHRPITQNVYDPGFANEKGAAGYDDAPIQCPPHTTEAKLMRKIDFRVIPFLIVMYFLCFLDRINIGNAVLYNMRKDLKLGTGPKYNDALVIFFVPYILFEIPSNILLKKFTPRIWLSSCLILVGFVTCMQGLVHNFSGLLATRFFLGVFETGVFPGCFYLISMWYKSFEAQRRYTFFFSSTTLAGAFGGLLAAAIGKMQGLRGYSGWRWIFILEGSLTFVVGIIFLFTLPNFPEDSNWLTEDEKAFVKARLAADQGPTAIERPIKLADVLRCFKDYKFLLGGFMYLGLIVTAYGYAYFSPSIIQTFKYTTVQTQLHSVPPWAASFVASLLIAFASDKARHRFSFILFSMAIAVSGYAVLLAVPSTTNNHVNYAALFLLVIGTYSAMPIILCWFQMNLGGHHRRSIGSAWQIAFGNIGGIIAVYAFLHDVPRYRPGYGTGLGFVGISLIATVAYYVACVAQNRERDRRAVDLSVTQFDKAELGDLSPDYRYKL
ncbi:MAG: hypothetical protein M1824_000228 [Vezdaea acicularis]|nr:MAG: hypothetical protein M1824_000228 [Vezdaea acicularis]